MSGMVSNGVRGGIFRALAPRSGFSSVVAALASGGAKVKLRWCRAFGEPLTWRSVRSRVK
jgi:hypothetical protein